MNSNLKVGALSGLAVGALIGLFLQFVSARTPAGNRVIMMEVIAAMAGSTSVIIGWLYHLLDNAVMGAIFGFILGDRSRSLKDGLRNGALYGFSWWILGGLILMPFFLGLSVFSPQTIAPVRPVAFQSFLGHLIYGLALGGVFSMLNSSRIKKSKARQESPNLRKEAVRPRDVA